MKVKSQIISKNKYSDIKIVSQSDGHILLNAKKDEKNKKALIIGERLSKQIAVQIKKMPKNELFTVYKHDYLQKYVERPFLQCINEENSEELHYLIPLQLARNNLKTSLKDHRWDERVEIAYKLSKVVQYFHKKEGRLHGSIELSSVGIKEKQDSNGIQVRVVPPFPQIIRKDALSRAQPSFYNAPQISQGVFGPQIDIWSLGIILYELLIAKEISEAISEVNSSTLKSFEHHLDFHLIKSIPLRNVIKKMLERSPRKRIQIQQVVCVLKREAAQEIYGPQYRIALINEQKFRPIQRGRREGKEEIDEHRILLKGFVLVVKYVEVDGNGLLRLQLHYKSNFILFLAVEYSFQEFTEQIKSLFPNLSAIYQQFLGKDKESIRFQSDGYLVVNFKEA